MTAEITVGWPNKALWPNGRAHWAVKNGHAQNLHAEAYWAAKEAKLVAPDGRVPVLLTFYPKPRGPAPDKDNAMASCKAALDGLAKAMGVDDRLFDPRVVIASERLSKVVLSIGGGE